MNTGVVGTQDLWSGQFWQPPALSRRLGRVAGATKLPIQAVNMDQAGLSDAESFAALHIRSITFHSTTQRTWEILHSNRDTFKCDSRG
jgi:hypothetical protein